MATSFFPSPYNAETEAAAVIAAAKRVQSAAGGVLGGVSLDTALNAVMHANRQAEYTAIREALTVVANTLTKVREA